MIFNPYDSMTRDIFIRTFPIKINLEINIWPRQAVNHITFDLISSCKSNEILCGFHHISFPWSFRRKSLKLSCIFLRQSLQYHVKWVIIIPFPPNTFRIDYPTYLIDRGIFLKNIPIFQFSLYTYHGFTLISNIWIITCVSRLFYQLLGSRVHGQRNMIYVTIIWFFEPHRVLIVILRTSCRMWTILHIFVRTLSSFRRCFIISFIDLRIPGTIVCYNSRCCLVKWKKTVPWILSLQIHSFPIEKIWIGIIRSPTIIYNLGLYTLHLLISRIDFQREHHGMII